MMRTSHFGFLRPSTTTRLQRRRKANYVLERLEDRQLLTVANLTVIAPLPAIDVNRGTQVVVSFNYDANSPVDHLATEKLTLDNSNTAVATKTQAVTSDTTLGHYTDTLSFDTTNLEVGPHTFTVTVTASGGGHATDNDTQSFDVILNVLATQLSTPVGTGVYGGAGSVSSTLTSANGPVAGQTVTFMAGSTNLGSGLTDANGVATITNATSWGLNAGSYVAITSFAGNDSTNPKLGASQSLPGSLVIAQAHKEFLPLCYTVTYDGQPHAPTGAPFDPATTTHTNAGVYTDYWFYHDPNGNYADASGSVIDTINKATATVKVTNFSGTYDGASHTASVVITGVAGESASNSITGTNVAESGSVSAALSDPDNYSNAVSGTATLTITPATATVSIVNYSGTYDGKPHTACVTITGVGNDGALASNSISGTNVADSGSISASISGLANYNDDSGTATLTITKADAVITVPGYTVTYDSAAHTSAGSAVGVMGETLTGLDLSGTTHTNAGNFTDEWTFTDVTGNYNDSNGFVTDSIDKATAQVVVTPYTGIYDGQPHIASVTIIGVASDGTLASNSITGTNVADSGTASASISGLANYNDASGTATLTIAPAKATVIIVNYDAPYDGKPHTASVIVTGVNGESASNSITGTNVADSGTASAALSDPGNYSNTVSGTATLAIAKADAIINVSGYTGTYDGAAHGATGTATGVKGETLAGLDLSGTVHTNAGAYSDGWSFTDVTGNYKDASGVVTGSIAKADATVTIINYTGTYDGASHIASVAITGVGGVELAKGSVSRTDAGHDSVSASTSDPNYNSASGTATIDIAKANAVFTVSGWTGTYDGKAHCASLVGSLPAGTTIDLGASFTNCPGGTANWVFHGGTNYNDQSGSAVITITQKAISLDFITQAALNLAKQGEVTFTAAVPAGMTNPAVLDGIKLLISVPNSTDTFAATLHYSVTAGFSFTLSLAATATTDNDTLRADLAADTTATNASNAPTVMFTITVDPSNTGNYTLTTDTASTKLFSTLK
jgi:hypothetical protein